MGFLNPRQALKIKSIYIYIISEYAWNYLKIKNNQPTNTKQNNCEHGKNDFSPGVCVPYPSYITTVRFLDRFRSFGLLYSYRSPPFHGTPCQRWPPHNPHWLGRCFSISCLEPQQPSEGKGICRVDSNRHFLKLKYEAKKETKLHNYGVWEGYIYIYAWCIAVSISIEEFLLLVQYSCLKKGRLLEGPSWHRMLWRE